MDHETTASVISVSRQWWLKVNTKPLRTHAMNGATFPYIIKVSYRVGEKEYIKRKWIPAGHPVPSAGASVAVLYDGCRPGKAKIL